MRQLVGLNCVHCQQRVSSELDARFCATCGSAVHTDCAARTVASAGSCPACRVPAAVLSATATQREAVLAELRASRVATQKAPAQGTTAQGEAKGPAIKCLRCDRPLEYVGTKAFHEGTRWGALGDLGEFFVNKERFDVFRCPACGHVEFFVDGLGEEHRPH